MPWITFINKNLRVSVEPGVSILEAARSAGLTLETPCGGLGVCGKCGVIIPRPEQRTRIRSGGGKPAGTGIMADQGEALACRSSVHGDIEVLIRDYAGENRSLRILAEGRGFSYEKSPYISKGLAGDHTEVYGGSRVLGTEPGNTLNRRYGVAVDIGTTTLASALIDLNTGRELARCSALNPQTAYAQDVISRIFFCRTAQGLETLRRVLTEALAGMIARMAGEAAIEPRHIYEVVYSGNTAMLHLACGVDPSPLGQYPYTPGLRGGNHSGAAGLGVSPFGLIYLPPIISAYVGADIVSGILASRLDAAEGTTIFIDVGTNGELVLARNGRLAAAATAAGPAFEGINITHGMRASGGAIESFSIDGDGGCSYQVIGGDADKAGLVSGSAAVGICGSGLLDIAGELVRTGVIEASGRFTAPEPDARGLYKRLKQREGTYAFYLNDTVCLTQQDIRQIQLAKGAIRAGIETLLAHFSIRAADVDTVEIAGSFGYHLNEESLINTGLLPPDFRGKIRFAGNTSLSGATAFLLNTGFREKMEGLVTRIDTIDLAKDPRFERRFVRHLGF